MSSQPARYAVAYETHVGINRSGSVPPPPPRDAPHTSPLRRDDVGLPPSLTTAIGTTQLGSHHATPLSATSHYSPFTSSYPVPQIYSAGSTSRNPSPMAPRQTTHFSVPYDPRDWAPGDVRANQARRVQEQQPDGPLLSPPPPYSPHRAQQEQITATAPRPRDSDPDETSRPTRSTSSQVSSSATPSTGVPVATVPRPRSFHPGSTASNRYSLDLSFQIPPPPPINPSYPKFPQPNANGSISAFGHSQGSGSTSTDPTLQAPAARRAVSANAGLSRDRNAGPSSQPIPKQQFWQPGTPLPGPPPGPPPSSSRSQSMTAAERSAGSSAWSSRTRENPSFSSGLDPVPPTPANWTDEQSTEHNGHNSLHIDTNVNCLPGSRTVAESIMPLSSGATPASGTTLIRSSAIRDSSAQGLRERRAQNRSSRLFSPEELGNLSVQISIRPKLVGDSVPLTSKSSPDLGVGDRQSRYKQSANSPLAGFVTSSSQLTESPMNVATPPLSPPTHNISNTQRRRSENIPPKALPTPPLSNRAPLSARSMPQSTTESTHAVLDPASQSLGDFLAAAVQRHTNFLRKEKLAQSDSARLQAFADYMHLESSIRQRRYASAIDSGEFNVQIARDRLFQPTNQKEVISASTEHFSPGVLDTRNITSQPRQDSSVWKDFQPALSPIASMDYDEMSSRGRAPSRWWESQTGSQSGGRAPHLQRSKRESKYMGLSKELLMAYSPSEEFPAQLANHTTVYSNKDNYPAEKSNPAEFGYFDSETPRTTSHPKAPETQVLLDISRFVTLPPPYPRHHPAVNNSHPALARYRNAVRTLSDLDEIRNRKARQRLSSDALRGDHQRRKSESRHMFRVNIQEQINDGSITFAEAAEAEQAYKDSEFEQEKGVLKSEFDTLQDVVINPLHDTLHQRITQLDSNIEQLQQDLCTDAQHQDPDGAQEAGDETPELLEKLTQLKWLFDTREQIHKECFDLVSDRNDKFRAIILLPYQYQRNSDKIHDTEAFFQRDAQTRVAAYSDECLRRHERFLRTVEEHVRRGVELQSSAFWDIAPGLVDILQKIPEDLEYLPSLQIPAKEYAENPSYHQHPAQYLYSLLSHAEKSTYQYIEGQINLQCLLHEVKTALLGARYRSMQSHEDSTNSQQGDLITSRSQEEASLTAELKQKASMIEEQWLEALGSQLQGTRERVKAMLQHDNAWEEIAHEDA